MVNGSIPPQVAREVKPAAPPVMPKILADNNIGPIIEPEIGKQKVQYEALLESNDK